MIGLVSKQARLFIRSPIVFSLRSQLGSSSGKGRVITKTAKSKLQETLAETTTVTSGNFGQKFLLGGSAIGLATLCYYGLSQSRGESALDHAKMYWTTEIKERIHSTYAYFGGSVLITAATAVNAFRSPKIMSIVGRGSWPVAIGGMIAVVASNMLTMSLPYPENGIGAKHLAWIGQNVVLGVILAPICVLGGPLLKQAAMYTAGIVGGLSAIAMTAPSEKFLTMGGALGMGLGVVFVASLGSMFASPVSALGSGLYAISLYGGLGVFSLFMLYDTQKIIKKAETYPSYGPHRYDPINNSISIYMDTVNIFIRIASILAGNNKKK